MRLPSKITSYGESVISKFPPVLSVLQDADTGVLALYDAMTRSSTNTKLSFRNWFKTPTSLRLF